MNCWANSGIPDLVAPCGTTDCCDLGDGAACAVMLFGDFYDPETTTSPTPADSESDAAAVADLAALAAALAGVVMLA